MKYKAGDIVRVQNKDYFRKNYDREKEGYRNLKGVISFINDDMLDLCDTLVIIAEIEESKRGSFYKIKEDEHIWSWDDWMFEGKVGENEENHEEESVGNADIIRDLCDYLDISVGQVIISKDTKYKYRLSEAHILEVYENDTWKICDSFTFIKFIIMLKERRFVTKWIPKMGETVYYMSLENSSLWDWCKYNDTEHDKMMVSKGLYFRTQREAMECAKEFLEQYKEDN